MSDAPLVEHEDLRPRPFPTAIHSVEEIRKWDIFEVPTFDRVGQNAWATRDLFDHGACFSTIDGKNSAMFTWDDRLRSWDYDVGHLSLREVASRGGFHLIGFYDTTKSISNNLRRQVDARR